MTQDIIIFVEKEVEICFQNDGTIYICDGTHSFEYDPVEIELNKKDTRKLYEAMKKYYGE